MQVDESTLLAVESPPPFLDLPSSYWLYLSPAGVVHCQALLCDSAFIDSKPDASMEQNRRIIDGVRNLSNYSVVRIAE